MTALPTLYVSHGAPTFGPRAGTDRPGASRGGSTTPAARSHFDGVGALGDCPSGGEHGAQAGNHLRLRRFP